MNTLSSVTPDQACAHPNWVMGRKISVDSATMMNKGLEVIEAHELFGTPYDRIEVVVHLEDWNNAKDADLSSLRLVMCGGSAVPRGLIDGFRAVHFLEGTDGEGAHGAVGHGIDGVEAAAGGETFARPADHGHLDLGITVHDHVIVGKEGHVSLKARGLV